MEIMPQPLRVHLQSTAEQIYRLPRVVAVILFGSYAKGRATAESDVDLAVFFDKEAEALREEYRTLSRICNCIEIDYQVQAFSTQELTDPCGIIEEILQFGKIIVPAGGNRERLRRIIPGVKVMEE
jgi:predicted nucleotidyltransferase